MIGVANRSGVIVKRHVVAPNHTSTSAGWAWTFSSWARVGAADVVDVTDVRVIQGGEGLGLALEPLLQFGIGRDVLRQNFDRDSAVEAGIVGLIDLAHAAGPQGGLDLIRAEAGTGGQSHGKRLQL